MKLIFSVILVLIFTPLILFAQKENGVNLKIDTALIIKKAKGYLSESEKEKLKELIAQGFLESLGDIIFQEEIVKYVYPILDEKQKKSFDKIEFITDFNPPKDLISYTILEKNKYKVYLNFYPLEILSKLLESKLIQYLDSNISNSNAKVFSSIYFLTNTYIDSTGELDPFEFAEYNSEEIEKFQDNYSEFSRYWILSMLKYICFHEFAHVLYDHDPQKIGPSEEAQADVLALELFNKAQKVQYEKYSNDIPACYRSTLVITPMLYLSLLYDKDIDSKKHFTFEKRVISYATTLQNNPDFESEVLEANISMMLTSLKYKDRMSYFHVSSELLSNLQNEFGEFDVLSSNNCSSMTILEAGLLCSAMNQIKERKFSSAKSTLAELSNSSGSGTEYIEYGCILLSKIYELQDKDYINSIAALEKAKNISTFFKKEYYIRQIDRLKSKK